MGEKKHLDFISAVALIIFSAAIILSSIQMYNKAGEIMYLSPALMPLILGIALLFCSVIYLAESLKDGGVRTRWNEFTAWFKPVLKDDTVHGMVIGVVIMAVYTFVLMSFLPFWISSIIFIIALMLYLKAASPARIALIAVGAVGLIVLLFQVLFRVPLP